MTGTFRTQVDGTAVCAHRDLSVCDTCAADPRVVHVSGAHFVIEDAAERAALIDALADIALEAVGL